MDFANLKPSDIIGGAFASDGKPGESPIELSIDQILGDAAQEAGLKQVMAIQLGGDSDNASQIDSPGKAMFLIATGMQMAVDGWNALHRHDELEDDERENLIEASNQIHATFEGLVKRLHQKAADAGKCTCDDHKAKQLADAVAEVEKKLPKKRPASVPHSIDGKVTPITRKRKTKIEKEESKDGTDGE